MDVERLRKQMENRVERFEACSKAFRYDMRTDRTDFIDFLTTVRVARGILDEIEKIAKEEGSK